MTSIRSLASAASRFGRAVLIDPIRRGRLRDEGWPVGLRPVVVVGVVAFALAVAVILLSPVVRALLPLSVGVGSTVLSLPRAMLPSILWLVLIAIALMQTAALHARARTSVVLTATASLVVLFLGGLDLGAGGELGLTPGKAVSVLAVVALVALGVLRRRASFAWWEFPVVLGIIGGTAVVSLARNAAESAPFGIDFGPSAVSLVISSIGQLAVPAAIAAGAAVAEFAVVVATAAVAAVHRPARAAAPTVMPRARAPFALIAAFLLVAAWRAGEILVGAVTGLGAPVDATSLPLSAAVLVAIGVLWAIIHRMRGAGRVSAADALERLDDVALPVAVALSITLAPLVLVLLSAQILASWGVPIEALGGVLGTVEVLRGTAVLTTVRAVVGLALLATALVLARRGLRGAPELLAAIGVIALASAASRAADGVEPWSSEAIAVLVAVATLALAAVLAARRSLDARRLALLTIALLLSAAAAWRDVLADPLSALIGASGIALVLFGFVWGFLTDAEPTHGDSPAYPRPTRVLLFLANAVFGVAVLAFGTLARDLAAGIDLDAFARSGDELLGTALIAAAVLATWSAVIDRSAASRPGRSTV